MIDNFSPYFLLTNQMIRNFLCKIKRSQFEVQKGETEEIRFDSVFVELSVSVLVLPKQLLSSIVFRDLVKHDTCDKMNLSHLGEGQPSFHVALGFTVNINFLITYC